MDQSRKLNRLGLMVKKKQAAAMVNENGNENENGNNQDLPEALQPKKGRQVQRRLPKILENGGFVLIFGSPHPQKLRPPESTEQAVDS